MGRKKLGDFMKSIYLIGFMGSGKTTIGKALSLSLNLPVMDSDEEVSRLTGKTIVEIFEGEGEVGFRTLETKCLRNLPVENFIITTGGGIVLKEENRQWMRENGKVVLLDASPEEILKRLEGDKTRPLLIGEKETKVVKILSERMPLYLDAADLIIETTDKSVETIIEELMNRLKFV
jgi:shikimate kinase